jgi:two-component system alkaline phosphatase synthesis response regulator PhoP
VRNRKGRVRSTAPSRAKGARDVRILLVDDEPQILKIYGEMLEGSGFRIATATDGKEALRLYREGGFDLLVLDLYMPKFDGFEALETIRETDPEIPIILMTGHFPDEVVADRIVGLNVAEVLRKPVMISALLNAVNRVLSGDTDGG